MATRKRRAAKKSDPCGFDLSYKIAAVSAAVAHAYCPPSPRTAETSRWCMFGQFLFCSMDRRNADAVRLLRAYSYRLGRASLVEIIDQWLGDAKVRECDFGQVLEHLLAEPGLRNPCSVTPCMNAVAHVERLLASDDLLGAVEQGIAHLIAQWPRLGEPELPRLQGRVLH